MGPVTLQTYEKEMELGNRGGENSSQRGKLQKEHRRRDLPCVPETFKISLASATAPRPLGTESLKTIVWLRIK